MSKATGRSWRRSLPSRARIGSWLLGPAAWLLTRLAHLDPSGWGERLSQNLATPLSQGLDRLSARIPFSLAESLLGLGLLILLVRVAVCFRRPARLRRAARLGADLLSVASLLLALFYVAWGLQYAREPLPARLDWSSLSADEADSVILPLAREFLERTNAAYLRLHGSADAGRPTPAPGDLIGLDRALESSWRELAKNWPRAGLARSGRGPAKPLWLSPVFRRLGLSGVYSPFTGEAHYNHGVPACALPQVLAHEKAHQRGVASESEANSLGFVAGLRSSDPLARYAALLFAQRQVLRGLEPRRSGQMQSLLRARLPGVQRDVDDLYAYWSAHRGAAQRLARRMNDAYLRSNRIDAGVADYSHSLRLILRYARLSRDEVFGLAP